jgi:uridine kinase
MSGAFREMGMEKEFPINRTLIIFTGGPGTGKSGTAERFLHYLNNHKMMKISVDQIKEKNWDMFGFDNVKQKERLNLWSLEEFYLTVQKKMWENKNILIEYPFYQRHKPKLEELIRENQYFAVTIYLYSDLYTIFQRGAKRDELDNRHPGHLVNQYHVETYDAGQTVYIPSKEPDFEEFSSAIAHKEYNIELGTVIPVDVTDFSKVNYEEIYQKIVSSQKDKFN